METANKYKPQRDSLAARVSAFFVRNPQDELSARDVAAKWDVDTNAVRACLLPAVKAQWLIHEDRGLGRVYAAGPNLRPVEAEPPKPSPAAVANASPFGQQPAKLPPPEELVIDGGIALPRIGRLNEYGAVFSQMRVGDSFACDTRIAKRLYDRAHQWGRVNGGAKFALRQMAPGVSRIWRIDPTAPTQQPKPKTK